MQDVPCDLSDSRYFMMFSISTAGWTALGTMYALLNVCLYWSYNWQAGTRTRDRLPIYVAAVEASVENMKGWEEVVRLRVYNNIVAVRTFPSSGLPEEEEKIAKRTRIFEQLREDREQKSKTLARKKAQKPDKPRLEVIDEVNVNEIKQQFKNAARFREKLIGPDTLGGSYLTYGWVLLFSTFCRQFLLMLSAIASASFPPFGAAAQSLVFMINFVALLVLFPYLARLLNIEEALLTGCMAVLTFLASFRELLTANRNASKHPTTIAIAGSLIDVLVIVIVSIIGVTMTYNAYIIGGSFLATESEETLLDKAHFEARMQQEYLAESEKLGRNVKYIEEQRLEEEAAEEKAFWDDPLREVNKGLQEIRQWVSSEKDWEDQQKFIDQIFSPFLREKKELDDAAKEEQERLQRELAARHKLKDTELQMMRFEEWRQRTVENWWRRQREMERRERWNEDPEDWERKEMEQEDERGDVVVAAFEQRRMKQNELWLRRVYAWEGEGMPEEEEESAVQRELREKRQRECQEQIEADAEALCREILARYLRVLVHVEEGRLERENLAMYKEEMRQRDLDARLLERERWEREEMQKEEQLQKDYKEFLIEREAWERSQMQKEEFDSKRAEIFKAGELHREMLSQHFMLHEETSSREEAMLQEFDGDAQDAVRTSAHDAARAGVLSEMGHWQAAAGDRLAMLREDWRSREVEDYLALELLDREEHDLIEAQNSEPKHEDAEQDGIEQEEHEDAEQIGVEQQEHEDAEERRRAGQRRGSRA
eukprot:TRINITY_DN3981_c0_g2_i9.p1 TRINITY_DN3981_c0_g2~~TRINITY_DN3981_c0_g2_i9.p1  ORF type:complete len:880 (-),score=223.43 TRINITY_DN3981_c0_g2_i9:261-2570(-)